MSTTTSTPQRGGSSDPESRIPMSFELGHWHGIALRAHWSAVITILLVADILAASLPVTAPHHSEAEYWLTGTLVGVLFVAAIFAHELAHTAVARHYRMPVRSVTLWMLGGVTALDGDAPTPAAEVAIAVSGPMMTVVVAGIAGLGAWLIPNALVAAALSWLAAMSLVLAVFNLLPAAPLDGGRVLCGLVWWRLHDRDRANKVAASAGRGLGVILIGLGIFETLAGLLGGLWLILLGWFIRSGATAEQRVSRANQLANRLADIPVEQAMSPIGLVVPQWWTVQQLLTHLAPARASQGLFVVVDLDGHVQKVVTPYDLARVPSARRAEVRIADVGALPRPVVVTVGTLLPAVATQMQAGHVAVVVDERHSPVGVVTPADIDLAATLAELAATTTGDQPPAHEAGHTSDRAP